MTVPAGWQPNPAGCALQTLTLTLLHIEGELVANDPDQAMLDHRPDNGAIMPHRPTPPESAQEGNRHDGNHCDQGSSDEQRPDVPQSEKDTACRGSY